MATVSDQRKIQHLYLRGGFGIPANQIYKNCANGLGEVVSEFLSNSQKSTELKVMNALEYNKQEVGSMSKEERAVFRNANDYLVKRLNIMWINKMCSGQEQLREKMTLFWHGHFASKNPFAWCLQEQNNKIRMNALGKFGDLLRAVSQDAVMILFLNLHQNKKDHPNENFARELMELFTLGEGNYTEKDIKEAGRAFTGWAVDKNYNFVKRTDVHDSGVKTFFGHTGNLTGDDIINIILENKQTSDFIVSKIYRFFVNDTPDKEIIEKLSESFYKSDYDIQALMTQIFTSDWFYDQKNIGVKIKSPVEFICNLKTMVGMNLLNNFTQVIFVQRLLGQILFHPPNVAGWPGGTSWIDSSSLMARMRLTDFLLNSKEMALKLKEDPDMQTPYLNNNSFKNARININWKEKNDVFLSKNKDLLVNELIEYYLQMDPGKERKELLKKMITADSEEAMLKKLTILLTGLPEYQLC